MSKPILKLTDTELIEILDGSYKRFVLLDSSSELTKDYDLSSDHKNSMNYEGKCFLDIETNTVYFIRFMVNWSYGYDFPDELLEHDFIEIVNESVINPEPEPVVSDSSTSNNIETDEEKSKRLYPLFSEYNALDKSEISSFYSSYDKIPTDKLNYLKKYISSKEFEKEEGNAISLWKHAITKVALDYKVNYSELATYVQNPSAYKKYVERAKSIYPYIYESESPCIELDTEITFYFSEKLSFNIGKYCDNNLFYFNQSDDIIMNLFDIDTEKGFKTIDTAFNYACKSVKSFSTSINKVTKNKLYGEINKLALEEFKSSKPS